MGTIPFPEYLASRPDATTPVDAADRILIIQGGVIKQIASANTGATSLTSETVLINAATTPLTYLPASGEIVYQKSDDSADIVGFAVSVVGQTMCQELTNGLANQGDSIRVKLIGSSWYKIG